MRFLIMYVMLSSARAGKRFKEIFCYASWEVNAIRIIPYLLEQRFTTDGKLVDLEDAKTNRNEG